MGQEIKSFLFGGAYPVQENSPTNHTQWLLLVELAVSFLLVLVEMMVVQLIVGDFVVGDESTK